MESLKKLLELLGTDNVAEIFNKQVNRRKVNYFPQTVNYFKLFFEHYAPNVVIPKTQ